MIIDISGIELTPGNRGEECKGNGKHFDKNGKLIECCCDECNYLVCCTADNLNCDVCLDLECIRNKRENKA